jgi:hypothetical protein
MTTLECRQPSRQRSRQNEADCDREDHDQLAAGQAKSTGGHGARLAGGSVPTRRLCGATALLDGWAGIVRRGRRRSWLTRPAASDGTRCGAVLAMASAAAGRALPAAGWSGRARGRSG